MKTRLRQEITLLLTSLALLLILGLIIGHALLLVCLGMVVYLLWTFYNLKRLLKWLSEQGRHIPDTYGIWDDVYYQLYQLFQRQRKAKRKLASIVGRFQESTQALPYATIVLNQNKEIEWFNNAAKRMFDLDRGFDIGQRIDNLIRLPQFIDYLATGEFKEDLELNYNERSIRLAITPYGNNQYLIGAHDITQRQKLEVMRRDFTANASHELRTPLTVVSGYIEALQDNVDERMRIPLQRIHEQTDRMQSILNDLIALSRLETGALPKDLHKIEVAELMQQVFEDMREFDRGAHQLEIECDPADIVGNREEIRIALANLMTNAIRYSAENTRVKLSGTVLKNTVCIAIEDQGIGIPAEHIPRLTERFYRVDPGRSREQGGTGLGLAIVKHILDRHHARLEVVSELDEGSVFRCYFPVKQDTE